MRSKLVNVTRARNKEKSESPSGIEPMTSPTPGGCLGAEATAWAGSWVRFLSGTQMFSLSRARAMLMSWQFIKQAYLRCVSYISHCQLCSFLHPGNSGAVSYTVHPRCRALISPHLYVLYKPGHLTIKFVQLIHFQVNTVSY